MIQPTYYQHKVLELIDRNSFIFDLNEIDMKLINDKLLNFSEIDNPGKPSSIAGTIIYVILKHKDPNTTMKYVSSNFVTDIIVNTYKRTTGIRECNTKNISMYAIVKWNNLINKLLYE